MRKILTGLSMVFVSSVFAEGSCEDINAELKKKNAALESHNKELSELVSLLKKKNQRELSESDFPRTLSGAASKKPGEPDSLGPDSSAGTPDSSEMSGAIGMAAGGSSGELGGGGAGGSIGGYEKTAVEGGLSGSTGGGIRTDERDEMQNRRERIASEGVR